MITITTPKNPDGSQFRWPLPAPEKSWLDTNLPPIDSRTPDVDLETFLSQECSDD